MENLGRLFIAILTFLVGTGNGLAEDASAVVAALEDRVPAVMEEYHVPGLSMALIRENRIVWRGSFGVRVAGEPERVNADTVFEAASMSKPLFSYAVLRLVEQGQFDLDRPLDAYLSKPYLPDESAANKITGRMVMLHHTGLPNWREGSWRQGDPLHLEYEPGSRFTYSGEGFLYLQTAVERITERPVDVWMQERLLAPLGMEHSSYRWQDAFHKNYAGGHDRNGTANKERRFYGSGNAAFSLYTTPTDYARFLIEIMGDDRSASYSLQADSVKSMTTLQVKPERDNPRSRRSLGWIVDAPNDGGFVQHTGTNGAGFHCVSRFRPDRKSGCVIMTNNVGARAACEQILKIIDNVSSREATARADFGGKVTTWAPERRTVRYEYRLINSADAAAADIDVYVPLPLNSARQEIHYLHLPNAPKALLATDRHGQRLAQYHIERLEPGDWIELGYVVGITLRNMQWDPESGSVPDPVVLTPEQRKLYLRPETNYSMDSKLMRSTAASLAEGAATEFEKLERIHDHVVNSIRYVRDNQWDPAETVLARGTGSCSEYNYVLSGLCRLSGLPTRCTGGTSNGFRDLPTTDTVFHRWTEVFLSDYGWFPVDCSRDANPIRGKRSHFGRIYTDAMVWCHQAGGENDTLGWDYRAHAHVRTDGPTLHENHRVRWFTFHPEADVEAAYDWCVRTCSPTPAPDLLECAQLRWHEFNVESQQRSVASLAAAGRVEALRRAALLPITDEVRAGCFRKLCASEDLAAEFLKESEDLWAFRNWLKSRETRLTAAGSGRFQLAEGAGGSTTSRTTSWSSAIWDDLASQAADRLVTAVSTAGDVSIVIMPPVDQTPAGLGDGGTSVLSTIGAGVSRAEKIRVIAARDFDRWMVDDGPGSGEYWVLAQGTAKPPADLLPDVIAIPVCIVDTEPEAAVYRLDLKLLKLEECKYTTLTAQARRVGKDEADLDTLIAGGDTMLARWEHDLVARHGVDWPLAGVADVLSAADATLCNLECCVSLRGKPTDKGERCPFYYRARPEMLQCLTNSGIDVVTAANNHAGDYGPLGIEDTIKWCDTAGVACVGVGRNQREAEIPSVLRVGSTLVAIAGMDTTMPYFAAGDDRPGTSHAAENGTLEVFARKIDRLAEWADGRCDLLGLTIHWGPNWDDAPTPTRQKMARIAFERGVDFILGHSAHRLQGIEIIEGKPVLYDMGNLLFDCELKPEGQRTALFRLVLSPRGVHRIEVLPAQARHGHTVLPTTSDAREILSEMRGLCSGLDTELTVSEDLAGRPIGVINIDAPEVTPRKSPSVQDTAAGKPIADQKLLASVGASPPSNTLPEASNRLPSPIALAPGLELLGYSVPEIAAQDGILRVSTWWKATDKVPENTLLALHLCPQGKTPRRGTPWYTRHDAGDWAVPLHRLQPGAIVEDDYPCRLAGLPPGPCKVYALVIDTSRPEVDRILCQPVQIGEVLIK